MECHTIVALRWYNELSQEEFSEIVGYARSTIAKIEAGQRIPSRKLILAIARHFKITDDFIDYLRKFEKMNNLPHDNDIKK